MKRLIRHFTIDTFSLWCVSQIASGITFSKGTQTLIIAGAALSVAFMFAKPVINVLLLPINLVTFGIFRWVSSAIVLYIVTLIIKDFRIENFVYSGFSSQWIEIPSLNLYGALSFIGFSFLLSIITSFIYWVIK